MRQILLAFLFVCFVFFTAEGQTVAQTALLKRLLDLPAPPPVNAEESQQKRERPPEFYLPGNIPPDDAPIEDLLDYWEKQNSAYDEFRYNQAPGKETLKRILDAVEKDHTILPNYLKILSTEPEAAELVKRIYQNEMQAQALQPYWFDRVRTWLRNNSDLFIGELIESAKSVRLENGFLRNQQDLISLAKVDWERAKPIVDQFESNPAQAELYTLAKYVLYHNAVKTGNSSDIERYRGELKKLVEDKKASYKTRDLAMDALVLGGDFPDRKDWYLSLLEDETLLELQENGFTGLTTLVRFLPNERESWMPEMLRMLDGQNPTLRSVAVRNILQIGGFKEKEVLVKLLPWLSDPKWARESRDYERRFLIILLREVEIPESVPGLITAVSNPSDEHRMEAAKTLVKYKSVEAITVLRRLLFNNENHELRESLIEALVAVGGFSDDEMMNALEAYAFFHIAREKERAAREDSDTEDDEDDEDETPVPVEISLGEYLFEYQSPTDGLVSRTIERIKTLQKTNPDVSALLLSIMEKWEHPLVDLEMLGWMTSGKANVETVLKLLAKRNEIRERVPNELSALREKNGLMRALGSVMLEDKNDLSDILRAADAETLTSLLAFARLVRAPLPVTEVAPLLKSENKTLALAAERYLEAEDSTQARTFLLAQFKSETRILGANQGFVPNEKDDFESLQPLLSSLFRSVNGSTFANAKLDGLYKTEKNLRQEIAANPDLLAVYGFVLNYSSASHIVRLYKDKIVYTYNEDNARYWEKQLTPNDHEVLTRFLIEKRIDNLAPINVDYMEEYGYPAGEFLMFGRNGGRRIFYQGYGVPEKLSGLAGLFETFGKEGVKLRYRLADKINGLEVLLADDNLTAKAVWKDKNDFRLLVADESERQLISEEIERQEKLERASGLTGGDLYEKQRERRTAAAYRHYSWRLFADGKPGADKIQEPAGIKYLSNTRQGVAISYNYAYAIEPNSFQRQIFDGEIEATDGALLKIGVSGAKTVIKEGLYQNPVVSADKKWVVVAKADEGFYLPNYVVRINLQTGREFRVNLPPADDFNAVAAIPGQNKILLLRKKDEEYSYRKNNPSPNTPEYYLLDPATGATQIARGEFRPLEQQTFRALQASAAPNEFWAALYNEKLNLTEIGYYNTLNLSFKPLMKLPDIELDSMDIWVDQTAAKVYFVYEGHLLSVPLTNQTN